MQVKTKSPTIQISMAVNAMVETSIKKVILNKPEFNMSNLSKILQILSYSCSAS